MSRGSVDSTAGCAHRYQLCIALHSHLHRSRLSKNHQEHYITLWSCVPSPGRHWARFASWTTSARCGRWKPFRRIAILTSPTLARYRAARKHTWRLSMSSACLETTGTCAVVVRESARTIASGWARESKGSFLLRMIDRWQGHATLLCRIQRFEYI